MARAEKDDELFHAARDLIARRHGATPWSGAAAMRLEDGTILTSTAPDVLNDAVSLCHETGALCEAFKLDKVVTHSICVAQPSTEEFVVLAPCGVCQERLFLYGPDVLVGVHTASGGSEFLRLADLQPHHWRQALPPA